MPVSKINSYLCKSETNLNLNFIIDDVISQILKEVSRIVNDSKLGAVQNECAGQEDSISLFYDLTLDFKLSFYSMDTGIY